jgi:hypothetical protein
MDKKNAKDQKTLSNLQHAIAVKIQESAKKFRLQEKNLVHFLSKYQNNDSAAQAEKKINVRVQLELR